MGELPCPMSPPLRPIEWLPLVLSHKEPDTCRKVWSLWMGGGSQAVRWAVKDSDWLEKSKGSVPRSCLPLGSQRGSEPGSEILFSRSLRESGEAW